MSQFRYTAVDASGQLATGTVDAADWQAAAALLAARGLTDVRELAAGTLPALSASDATELAGYLAELSKSGLPLAGTLRALAADGASPALKKVIDELIHRLQSGQSLDAALDALGGSLPAHLRRLMIAAAQGGKLTSALETTLAHQRLINDMGQRLRQALIYPLLLIAFLCVWLLFISVEVLPQLNAVLGESVDEYEQFWQSDSLSRTSFWLRVGSQWVPWLLCGGLTALALLVLGMRAIWGSAGLSRLISRLPLVGPCWRCRSMADFTGLLSEFVDAQVTLPEALELTATGVHDHALRGPVHAVATEARHGTSLAASLYTQRVFPHTLVEWAAWGQHRGALAEALRAICQMQRESFELRLQQLRAMLPAIVFSLIAVCAIVTVGTIFRSLTVFIHLLDYTPRPSPTPNTPVWTIAGALAGALLLGGFLLLIGWIVRSRNELVEVLALFVRIAGRMLLLAFLLAGLQTLTPYGWIAWIIIVAVWLRGMWKSWQLQRQALWATLSLATAHNAPLAPLAMAFADEQRGILAMQTRELARQLAAGVSLADAARSIPAALPADAPLAARVGTDSGDLVGALRAARGPLGHGRPLMPHSVVWLLAFLPVAIGIMLFVQIKIMPSMVKIFDDFDMYLPALTIFMISSVHSNWLPYACLLAIALALLVWLQWRGTLTPRLPGLKSIVGWIELAPLLRTMALAAERGLPLNTVIDATSKLHPRRWVRRRMNRVLADMRAGSPWQESLRRRKLLGDHELALLYAAERNGNLPFAMAELGNGLQRRAEYRLKLFGEFAWPLLITVMGLMVALFAIACFLPVARLILDLS